MASPSFPAPLIILSPPRSFSSVVSTMLGEHPQMYGFPELHLFLGETIGQVSDKEYKRNKMAVGSPGVIRSLAQIHEGEQTTAGAVRAGIWLNERRDWTTKQLTDYLFEKVNPKVAVEKSPPTVVRTAHLERAYAYYPDAFFLHLTRHPVTARQSLKEFQQKHREQRKKRRQPPQVEQLITWRNLHLNILRFTSTLPAGQTMRIRGEDILSEPDVFLPQIAEWMGLRTDKQAVEAMKHPENSPYASIGPAFARGGNDGKFMNSPKLRFGKLKIPSLEKFFQDAEEIGWFSEWFTEAVEQGGLHIVSNEEIEDQIAELAASFGYW